MRALNDQEDIVNIVTKSKGRKSLYHFTRGRNLKTIAQLDTLCSSYHIHPYDAGERRLHPKEVAFRENLVMINAHLRIPEQLIDASTTMQEFRATLDRHVFFWPTRRDCLKMLDTYTRREPNEAFAILEFDAHDLLLAHFSAVKLSKYDSGSSPRFPKHCTYKKSPNMFLPLNEFLHVDGSNTTWPSRASDIKEILIAERVTNISQYIRNVYVHDRASIPDGWRGFAKPLQDFIASR